MAVRTRPPPEGPRAPPTKGGIKPGSEKSLSGGLAAWLRTRTGGRLPKFPGPDCGEARKPPPSTRGAGSGEARPASPALPALRAEEAKKERRGLSSPHLTGGRLRGGERVGAPGGGQHPRSPEFVFAFGPTAERMPGNVVLAAAGSRLATGGDARPAYRGEVPGSHADYKSLQRGRRRSRLRASRAPRPRAGRGSPPAAGRLPARAAPPAGWPTAPRGPGKCARARVRGVARDTAAAGSALCVFPNRGRTCLLPSPRPCLLAFPWRWP